MRLILSRKGFDSAAGGVASPILPDGTMLSLPIPEEASPIRYRDIRLHGHDVGQVVADLTRRKVAADAGAHLDPDLVAAAIPRPAGWRPLFGQADNEQRVLEREGVGVGDVFLFFGWFRRVEERGDRYAFVRGAPDLHVLWGWLQVGEVVAADRSTAPPWATHHPHFSDTPRRPNVLYVAADHLVLDRVTTDLPGAGVFGRYHDDLCLTAPGCTRSVWRLPGWFHPDGGRMLGYHGDRRRWSRDGEHAVLRSVGRGQEFVFDAAGVPAAGVWVRRLIERASSIAQEGGTAHG
ncbi:MAG: hypothetical protein HY905_15850 [Deltaproteobacteria bacterium]|nr:hypothetical protein [Deltaproteobacteria bacterium]